MSNIASNKRWIIFGTIICALLCILLLEIAHLTPPKIGSVTNIIIDNSGNLRVEGENLPADLFAVVTPSILKQQQIISSSHTWGRAFDIAVQHNYLWVANGDRGLVSYNIQRPDRPIITGDLPLAGVAWRLSISGNKAFVAGGNSGLYGIDISKPAAPKLIFTKYTDMVVLAVATIGDVTIAATAKNGIVILDTSDLNHPKQIQHMQLSGNLQAIAIDKNYAYIAGKNNLNGIMHIVDISNLHQPKTITSIKLPCTVWSCAISGDKLLLALGKGGIYSLDIKDPTNITKPVKPAITTAGYRLNINKNEILIASSANRMYRYQNNNGALEYISTFTLPSRCSGVSSYKNLFIAALSNHGFAILDRNVGTNISAADVPLPIINPLSADIIHHGNTICVKNGNLLHLLQIEHNGTITLYDSIQLPSKIGTYTMDDQYAYVGLYNHELHIIGLTSGQQQRTQNTIKLNSAIRHISIDDKTIYLATTSTGLVKINIDDIHHLQPFSPPLTSDAVFDFIVRDELLFLTNTANDFTINHLNNDGLPTLMGTLHYLIPSHLRLRLRSSTIHKNHLFATNGSHGILSIDISDLRQPTLCGSLDLGGRCDKLIIARGYAYVTIDNNYIKMIDISDPHNMRVICKFPSIKALTEINGRLLLLTDNGIIITAVPQPLTIKSSSGNTVIFAMPTEIKAGSFDLQIANGQELQFYNDLLHYGTNNRWEIAQLKPEDKN